MDVVVVGSGVSGSAAAMTAARRAPRVALLEKQQTFGGSAALSAGMFWTAPTVDAYRARIPLGNPTLAPASWATMRKRWRSCGHRGREWPPSPSGTS